MPKAKRWEDIAKKKLDQSMTPEEKEMMRQQKEDLQVRSVCVVWLVLVVNRDNVCVDLICYLLHFTFPSFALRFPAVIVAVVVVVAENDR